MYIVKAVPCNVLFGGVALKYHAVLNIFIITSNGVTDYKLTKLERLFQSVYWSLYMDMFSIPVSSYEMW